MAGLLAGAARAEITPQIPGNLTGYLLREGACTGVHDPVFARALALDRGEGAWLLVSVDVLDLSRADVALIRDAIALRIGVGAQAITIACSHTHSGPASVYLRHCGEVDEHWLTWLRHRLVDLAAEAWQKRRPARLAAAVQPAERPAGINRRVKGGPVDPTLGLLYVTDTGGAPIACMVHHTCHPVVLGHESRLMSAEWPGVVASEMEARLGAGAVALFANGASGNINPVERGSFAHVEETGKRLAGELAAMLEGLVAFSTEPRIVVAERTLDLPLLPPLSETELRAMAEQGWRAAVDVGGVGPTGQKVTAAFQDWARHTLQLVRAGAPRTTPATVQVVCIGDLLIAVMPGEPFVELGLAIKKALAPHPVLAFGYCNGTVGYIPARSAYERPGYEAGDACRYYGWPSPLAPEAGELAASTLVDLGRQQIRG